MGAHFEALTEGVLMAPLDSRYTQVVFKLITVQVCASIFFNKGIVADGAQIFELLIARAQIAETLVDLSCIASSNI